MRRSVPCPHGDCPGLVRYPKDHHKPVHCDTCRRRAGYWQKLVMEYEAWLAEALADAEAEVNHASMPVKPKGMSEAAKAIREGARVTRHDEANYDNDGPTPDDIEDAERRHKAQFEKHDYEPSTSSHPMHTDPLCAVCGYARQSWQH